METLHTTQITALDKSTLLYITYEQFKKMISEEFVVSITQTKTNNYTYSDVKAVFNKRRPTDRSCMNIRMFYDLCCHMELSAIVTIGNHPITNRPMSYALGILIHSLHRYRLHNK